MGFFGKILERLGIDSTAAAAPTPPPLDDIPKMAGKAMR